jgi:hypothetical protein
MSLAEIAQETGRRWQDLSHTARSNKLEKSAVKKLQQCKADRKEYGKTPEFRNHQSYLDSFNKTQGQPKLSPSASRMSMTPDPKDSDQSSTLSGTEEELYSAEFSNFTLFNLRAPENSNISPLKDGMEEVNRIYTSLGVGSRSSPATPYPPESYTTSAVEVFLHNTGSLLYLWSHDEAHNLLRSVYHSKDGPSQQDATELFAMSAIGSYCDGDVASTTFQQPFMDSFIYLLQSRDDIDELHSMRLFACLAICRFTFSVESTRRLMRK